MKRLTAVAATAALVVATGLAAAFQASAADTGAVYVVHGIPDTPVDVWVDGALLLDDVQPDSSDGPFDLPAGEHQVAITAPDAVDDSAPILDATATVPAGGSVTLVAHLTEAGDPTLTPFANDVGPVPAGQARLIVRHTAKAPEVDMRAGGRVVLPGVGNGDQGALVLQAGTITTDAVLSGADTVVIGPWDQELREGTTTVVQAVGSPEDGIDLVTFVIEGMDSPPGGVPAGGGPAAALPSMVLVLGLVVGTGLVLAGSRRWAATR